jgi:hypothetical protein
MEAGRRGKTVLWPLQIDEVRCHAHTVLKSVALPYTFPN